MINPLHSRFQKTSWCNTIVDVFGQWDWHDHKLAKDQFYTLMQPMEFLLLTWICVIIILPVRCTFQLDITTVAVCHFVTLTFSASFQITSTLLYMHTPVCLSFCFRIENIFPFCVLKFFSDVKNMSIQVWQCELTVLASGYCSAILGIRSIHLQPVSCSYKFLMCKYWVGLRGPEITSGLN